ncbi:MAG: thrombospondin type 3 repeat-containing protein [Phaeodactylibacter sp.]|nr:thrombospondin type 3 repeat-containing protein [Phaeodactylibacter sp.]
MRLHIIFCTTFVVLLQGGLQSQSAQWEGGFLAGLAGYQGELTATMFPELDETGALYGFMVRYHLHPEWAIRSHLVYTSFEGEDLPKFQPRNYRFQSTVGAAALGLEWEPWGSRRYPGPRQFRRLISPYVYVTGGWMTYSAEASFENGNSEVKTSEIEQDLAQTYPKSGFMVTAGGGIKMDVSRSMVVGFELSNTTAFSDLLDGISEAGNPATNDWMPAGAVTVTFRLLPKDQDKDGIADKEDNCPKVKGNWSAFGCPDEDGDGVEDLEDLCLGEAGLPSLNGCPDSDSDGIADREDRCPTQTGTLATQGCPDWDADGLADLEDECPRLPGSKGRFGCPVLDTDADGVLEDEVIRCQIAPEISLTAEVEFKYGHFFEWMKHLMPPQKKPIVEEFTFPDPASELAPDIFDF